MVPEAGAPTAPAAGLLRRASTKAVDTPTPGWPGVSEADASSGGGIWLGVVDAATCKRARVRVDAGTRRENVVGCVSEILGAETGLALFEGEHEPGVDARDRDVDWLTADAEWDAALRRMRDAAARRDEERLEKALLILERPDGEASHAEAANWFLAQTVAKRAVRGLDAAAVRRIVPLWRRAAPRGNAAASFVAWSICVDGAVAAAAFDVGAAERVAGMLHAACEAKSEACDAARVRYHCAGALDRLAAVALAKGAHRHVAGIAKALLPAALDRAAARTPPDAEADDEGEVARVREAAARVAADALTRLICCDTTADAGSGGDAQNGAAVVSRALAADAAALLSIVDGARSLHVARGGAYLFAALVRAPGARGRLALHGDAPRAPLARAATQRAGTQQRGTRSTRSLVDEGPPADEPCGGHWPGREKSARDDTVAGVAFARLTALTWRALETLQDGDGLDREGLVHACVVALWGLTDVLLEATPHFPDCEWVPDAPVWHLALTLAEAPEPQCAPVALLLLDRLATCPHVALDHEAGLLLSRLIALLQKAPTDTRGDDDDDCEAALAAQRSAVRLGAALAFSRLCGALLGVGAARPVPAAVLARWRTACRALIEGPAYIVVAACALPGEDAATRNSAALALFYVAYAAPDARAPEKTLRIVVSLLATCLDDVTRIASATIWALARLSAQRRALGDVRAVEATFAALKSASTAGAREWAAAALALLVCDAGNARRLAACGDAAAVLAALATPANGGAPPRFADAPAEQGDAQSGGEAALQARAAAWAVDRAGHLERRCHSPTVTACVVSLSRAFCTPEGLRGVAAAHRGHTLSVALVSVLRWRRAGPVALRCAATMLFELLRDARTRASFPSAVAAADDGGARPAMPTAESPTGRAARAAPTPMACFAELLVDLLRGRCLDFGGGVAACDALADAPSPDAARRYEGQLHELRYDVVRLIAQLSVGGDSSFFGRGTVRALAAMLRNDAPDAVRTPLLSALRNMSHGEEHRLAIARHALGAIWAATRGNVPRERADAAAALANLERSRDGRVRTVLYKRQLAEASAKAAAALPGLRKSKPADATSERRWWEVDRAPHMAGSKATGRRAGVPRVSTWDLRRCASAGTDSGADFDAWRPPIALLQRVKTPSHDARTRDAVVLHPRDSRSPLTFTQRRTARAADAPAAPGPDADADAASQASNPTAAVQPAIAPESADMTVGSNALWRFKHVEGARIYDSCASVANLDGESLPRRVGETRVDRRRVALLLHARRRAACGDRRAAAGAARVRARGAGGV
ncbi:hypothetical protein M885DRAFT_108927 [Pelagophyceae sp. CCMP2097]|nr:hypothetical protein M885DRAFT_108927 [Pelagophyceae sp. CCMP2097]